jgi:hypothetical protein
MFLQFSDIDSWIAGMKKKHTFGDNVSLGAFTMLYGTDVTIWEHDTDRYHDFNNPCELPILLQRELWQRFEHADEHYH